MPKRFRIEPHLKEELRMAADQEHRSLANMMEVMVGGHCGPSGITIQEQQPMPLEDEGNPQPPER
jgi:hypothetical protein